MIIEDDIGINPIETQNKKLKEGNENEENRGQFGFTYIRP